MAPGRRPARSGPASASVLTSWIESGQRQANVDAPPVMKTPSKKLAAQPVPDVWTPITPKSAARADKENPLPEDDRPECAICLEEPKDVGVLDGCEHIFCFSCISQWAEMTNLCPLCKRRFQKIQRLSNGNTPVPDRPVRRSTRARSKAVKHRDLQDADLISSESESEDDVFVRAQADDTDSDGKADPDDVDFEASPAQPVSRRRAAAPARRAPLPQQPAARRRTRVTSAPPAPVNLLSSPDEPVEVPMRRRRTGRVAAVAVAAPSLSAAITANAHDAGRVQWIKSRVTGKWVRGRTGGISPGVAAAPAVVESAEPSPPRVVLPPPLAADAVMARLEALRAKLSLPSPPSEEPPAPALPAPVAAPMMDFNSPGGDTVVLSESDSEDEPALAPVQSNLLSRLVARSSTL